MPRDARDASRRCGWHADRPPASRGTWPGSPRAARRAPAIAAGPRLAGDQQHQSARPAPGPAPARDRAGACAASSDAPCRSRVKSGWTRPCASLRSQAASRAWSIEGRCDSSGFGGGAARAERDGWLAAGGAAHALCSACWRVHLTAQRVRHRLAVSAPPSPPPAPTAPPRLPSAGGSPLAEPLQRALGQQQQRLAPRAHPAGDVRAHRRPRPRRYRSGWRP